MSEHKHFLAFVKKNILEMGKDRDFIGLSRVWNREALRYNYAMNFSWIGRPIIQTPQDIYAIQEIIWEVKPDLIIETGIAHGGSLILSASILAQIDYCEAAEKGCLLSPRESKRRVLGIDIDIRSHNREAIEKHPLSHLIDMIEGSSIEHNVIQKVKKIAGDKNKILVFLDSNHTHAHVLSELEAYAPLVSKGSYCVVWDTGIDDIPDDAFLNRPWGKGNNPKTAVFEYLDKIKEDKVNASDGARLEFEADKNIEYKIAITAATDGFLRRV